MISTWQLLIVIGCYLFSVYVMYKVFKDRMKEMETEYRLNFARVCTTCTDAMQSVAKALEAVDTVDTDDGDKESSND